MYLRYIKCSSVLLSRAKIFSFSGKVKCFLENFFFNSKPLFPIPADALLVHFSPLSCLSQSENMDNELVVFMPLHSQHIWQCDNVTDGKLD